MLDTEVLFTDDSVIPLLEHGRGKTRKARLWVYVRGDPRPRLTAYDFTLDRCKGRPLEYLANYQGYVHADAYSGYEELFKEVGFRVLAPGCGACINAGPGVSTSPDQVTISSINRNFPGRSGPGRLYLASPLTMMASALAGRIVAYKPLLDAAIDLADHKPRVTVMVQRAMAKAPMTRGRDIDWDEVMTSAEPADCVPVAATDPLYILYTSGTTGRPKGVVRDNGGHAVALKWSMKNVYGIDPGEVYWAASDIGWVVGHSYIVYAPLFHGCTTILFEGKPVGTPDAGVFWRVISQHQVTALFTAPTAFRAIKQQDPNGEHIKKYALGGFRTLFLAGERADPDTVKWAEHHLRVPVIDHWWQTETGWAIGANCIGLGMQPVKYGSATKAVPGFDVHVLDKNRRPVKPGKIGTIVIKLPLPPGCLPSLWNNDEGFKQSYLSDFPGYYLTADAGYIDEDGYIFVMSRTDDIINVAGHRLSTGAMEEVLAGHPDVAECAVIGVAEKVKGQVPLGFVVLTAGVERADDDIVKELVAMVREQIGPVAAFTSAVVVKRLPKTRSGKILRGTMCKIADGEEYRVPATIDDPAVLDEIGAALQGIGHAGAG
ncbi:MAG: AMP-binding protein [Proteobacteria bacterium]|nr:AMP-binding protein [Pseudomonadota bacterium]